MRQLDVRLRTYGITAVLGVATLGGVAPQCEPAPAPAPAPAVAPVSNVQDSVVRSVNHHRSLAGRAPVVVDARLTAAAQGHADDLARRQTLTHDGTGGTNGGQRITNAGYRWSTWGENVASGQSTPADVMSAWVASPGHRANILHAGVGHIGVAATTGSDGVVYWTMVVAAGS
jgi:uncharacterized protein YkwD